MLSARHELRKRFLQKYAQRPPIVPDIVFFLENGPKISPILCTSCVLELKTKAGADHSKLGILGLIHVFDAMMVGHIEGNLPQIEAHTAQ